MAGTAQGAVRIALCLRATGSSCTAKRNRGGVRAVNTRCTRKRPRRIASARPRRGRIIERPDQVEHHRWTPLPPSARGLAPLDAASLALLRRLHWRASPREPRRLWTGLAFTLLLHLLLGALIVHELRPTPMPQVPATTASVLQVRLIERATPATPAAPPPPPAPPPRRRPVPRAVPPPAATPAPEPTKQEAMTAHIYDREGRVELPPAPASSAPPAYVSGRLQGGDTRILKHDAGDKYRSKDTRFAPYFPPPGESSVDTAIRHVIEKTTKTGTVHLPKGVRVHCSTVLFILPVGCGGDPPAPPPPTDGDERLNMAPAPLARPQHPPKAPDVDACIALYRAGKPLPHGCPVDTPTRAVDAGMRELERKHRNDPGGG